MRKKKWLKRLGIAVATLIGVVVGLTIVGWALLRGTPEWYRPRTMTAAQSEAVAKRAEDKMTTVQNQAALARVNAGAATSRPSDAITISFSDDEINAIFNKWSVWQNVKESYERFVLDPCVVLDKGRLILAGRAEQLNSVASLHFEPQLDEQGRLNIKLVRVLAGKLPLPKSVLSKYQQKAATAVVGQLPGWRLRAAIDQTGIANNSAISAVMGQLLIDVLDDKAAEPVLFVPLIQQGCIPVKVLDVKIEDHTLTLVVQPMNPQQRIELLNRLQSDATVQVPTR